MHPISSASIESLPNELLLPILKACAVPSLFSVCKRWHHLLDSEVMPPLYKQIGKVHVPQGNVNEQAFIVDGIYKLEEKLSKAAKVNAIFRQIFTLAKSLSTLEFKVQIEEKRYLTLANYSSYLLNTNRLLVWKKLPGGKEYLSREEIKLLPLEKKGELFRDWIEENCKNLTSLNLSNAGLTYLPSEIGQLSQLAWLYLNQNQLTALPAEIGQLSQLLQLILNQNQLTALPAEIGQLSELQGLCLNQNQLSALPTEIGQLSQLQWLELNQNQLTSLPAEIGRLSYLQTLELAENPLKDIPEKIRQRFQL
jgi:hypothetical protein